jgi:hypothetical protein
MEELTKYIRGASHMNQLLYGSEPLQNKGRANYHRRNNTIHNVVTEICCVKNIGNVQCEIYNPFVICDRLCMSVWKCDDMFYIQVYLDGEILIPCKNRAFRKGKWNLKSWINRPLNHRQVENYGTAISNLVAEDM